MKQGEILQMEQGKDPWPEILREMHILKSLLLILEASGDSSIAVDSDTLCASLACCWDIADRLEEELELLSLGK